MMHETEHFPGRRVQAAKGDNVSHIPGSRNRDSINQSINLAFKLAYAPIHDSEPLTDPIDRLQATSADERRAFLPAGRRWAFPMYTPPILEEEEEEAEEEREYEAQFERLDGLPVQQPPAPKAPGAPTMTTFPPRSVAPAVVDPEEVKEAPHILVDLPPHVEQQVEEVAEEGGRCGVGRCRAWLYVLRVELQHEEQWRLPVLPRNSFIDFKFSRPPPPEALAAEMPNPWFVVFRVALLMYWSSWVTVAVVGAQRGVRIPPPVYESLGYNALW